MALNFLVTGVKVLAKTLGKKKMKEKAKKFIGGDKEGKRAKISKIMDRESSYGGKTKAKKPASIDKSKLMKVDIDKVAKVTPDSAKIDYKAFTAKVDNIVGMTDALAFLTGAQSEQKKEELKLLRQQKEEEKRRKKEAKLEKKGGLGDKIKAVKDQAVKNPLSALLKFVTSIALGALAMFLVKNVDKIKEIFKTIGDNLNKFSKLLRVAIFGFQEGMKLVKAGFKMAGKGLKKVLSPIGKAFKAIGSKISGVFKALGGKFLKVIKKIPGVSQLTKMVTGAKKGADATKAVLTAKKEALKKGFNKVTGGVLKKGLAKAPSRLITKLFGKNAAKAVAKSGKLFKVLGKAAKGIKIPVLGPIIVAVTSILSGDPIGKTMFKTLGAVFGGMIGGAIGAALGGVGAPFGLLLGEIVGEFIGSFLYDMFNGDEDGTKGVDFLKKKFGQLLSGTGKALTAVANFALSMLGKAGNFIKDGVGRFIKNFPTVDISKIKFGFGLASIGAPWALGKLASLIPGDPLKGMKNDKGEIDKIPNLGLLAFPPLLIPHLFKSLFPGGGKEIQGGTEVGDEVAVSGGEEGEETTAAVVETPDNTDTTIDDSASGGGTTTAELGEKDTSSTSSTVSDVSSKASYEESAAGTVVLTKPERKNYTGRSGQARYEQAMIMYNNQKEMLNSYQKTQVKASLAKI